eukprot:gene9585-10572_t
MSTTGAGKGNFSSKFLNLIGGKKKPKPKYGSTGSDESDEDGYMDPEGLCPTEPPRDGFKPPIPDYPPPNCPTSKTSNPQLRPYSSIDCSSNLQSSTTRSHALSLESGGRVMKPPIAAKPKGMPSPRPDDYSDPWDSKAKTLNPERPAPPVPQSTAKQHISQTRKLDNYMDPYDKKVAKPSLSQPMGQRDNYMDPYDSKKVSKPPLISAKAQRDNYIEPFDTRTKPCDFKKSYKDDYKDPWDSKMPTSLPKSSYEEDEDYTVPYDAGPTAKSNNTIGNGVQPSAPLMDDIYDLTYEDQIAMAKAKLDATDKRAKISPKQQPKVAPKADQDDNYEEPWEYTAKTYPINHASKPPPKPAHQATALAQQKRPSDDYDAPWEWSEKSLSKAIAKLPPPSAKQSEMSRERVESSLSNQSKPTMLQTNQRQHSTESAAQSQPSTLERAYEVDPTIPLENQSWYHGKISRYEAESLLRDLPDCSYLIRDSESAKTDFSLSLRNHNEPMHLKISCPQGKFILGQNSRPYDTIPEMIHHYSMNTLNIKGAEQVKLIYPVIQEAMYFTVEPGS